MKKHFTVALAFAAGLLGGLVSRYIAPTPVLAQNQSPVVKELRAQSFVLVSPSGRTIATFAPDSLWSKVDIVDPRENRASRIVITDSNGREIWSAGGSPFRTPSER